MERGALIFHQTSRVLPNCSHTPTSRSSKDSKSEYNRCKIGRLTIGEEIDKEERMIQEAEVRGYEEVEGEDKSTEEENNS